MPQLDKFTFVSQVVWFTIVLFLLYFYLVGNILPSVARTLKLRNRELEAFGMLLEEDEGEVGKFNFYSKDYVHQLLTLGTSFINELQTTTNRFCADVNNSVNEDSAFVEFRTTIRKELLDVCVRTLLLTRIVAELENEK